MKQEFVTLPREVVEWAVEVLFCTDSKEGSTTYENELEAVKKLRAALEQPKNHIEQHLGMVPAGWKLVPVEPTEKMIDMGRGLSSFPDGVYRAMLAAAPKPPALKQPQVKASAIPAGWKLVPSDATHQWAENLADRGMRISSLASAISDMLAAAPQPPTTEESSAVEQQVEQEPVALLADAIRAEPTELIHKWRVLELIQDHARQQTKREPLTDEQIERAWQFLHDEEGNTPDQHDFARAIIAEYEGADNNIK